MRIRLPLLAMLIILDGFASPGIAQDQVPSNNMKLAEELVGVMHLDQGMNSSLDKMKQMQQKIADFTSTKTSPEAKAMAQRHVDTARDLAKAVMNVEKQKEMYVAVYANTYTAEELQGAIDFYKTPIGQKWAENQPKVNMEIATKSMEMMPQIMDSLKSSMGALDALRGKTNTFPETPAATPSPEPSPATNSQD